MPLVYITDKLILGDLKGGIRDKMAHEREPVGATLMPNA